MPLHCRQAHALRNAIMLPGRKSNPGKISAGFCSTSPRLSIYTIIAVDWAGHGDNQCESMHSSIVAVVAVRSGCVVHDVSDCSLALSFSFVRGDCSLSYAVTVRFRMRCFFVFV